MTLTSFAPKSAYLGCVPPQPSDYEVSWMGFQWDLKNGVQQSLRGEKLYELYVDSFKILKSRLENVEKSYLEENYNYIFIEENEDIRTLDIFKRVLKYAEQKFSEKKGKLENFVLNQIGDFRRVIDYTIENKPLFLIREQVIAFQDFICCLKAHIH